MVFILNKFNIILRKYPFYIQSLNKYVNYILPSTATCDPCAWAGKKTCRLSSLQKRCTGMHLAHVLKESFQGFFSDVCFGWKDFVLTHLQRTWLADKAASHTPHTACSVGRTLPHGMNRDQVTPMAVPWARAPSTEVELAQTHPKAPHFLLESLQPLTNLLCYHQCQLEAKPRVHLNRCEQPEQEHGSFNSELFHWPNPPQEDNKRNRLILSMPKPSKEDWEALHPPARQDNNTPGSASPVPSPSPGRSFLPTTILHTLNQSEPSHLFQREGLKMIIPNKCKGFRTGTRAISPTQPLKAALITLM